MLKSNNTKQALPLWSTPDSKNGLKIGLKGLLRISVAVLAFTGAGAYAQSAGDLERKIEAARKQLDDAAQALAELHKRQYMKGGQFKSDKAMLGILLGDEDSSGGVDLVGVSPGGGAEAAGLKAGDKIVTMGGLSLAQANDPMSALVKFMKNVSPGESVALVYERDGQTYDATVVTQAKSSHMMKIITHTPDIDIDMITPHIDVSQFGHQIETEEGRVSSHLLHVEGDLARYFDVEQGVVLISALEGSQLRAGDVLLEIDGEAIEGVDAAVEALESLASSDGLNARIKRRGKNQSMKLTGADYDAADSHAVRVIRIKNAAGEAQSDVRIEVRD